MSVERLLKRLTAMVVVGAATEILLSAISIPGDSRRPIVGIAAFLAAFGFERFFPDEPLGDPHPPDAEQSPDRIDRRSRPEW